MKDFWKRILVCIVVSAMFFTSTGLNFQIVASINAFLLKTFSIEWKTQANGKNIIYDETGTVVTLKPEFNDRCCRELNTSRSAFVLRSGKYF